MSPDSEHLQPGFFIKLAEIPDLLEKLEDPEFNQQLSADPRGVLGGLGISFPQDLVPETVSLPPPERIAELNEAARKLRPQAGDEALWFPFFIIWWYPFGFPFAWYPFFVREGDQG